MIIKNNETISSIYVGEKVIKKIYKGNLTIYKGWANPTVRGVLPLTLSNCATGSLKNYKICGNSEQTIPMEGYQQVEYIESSGTQYIDTGFIADQDTRVITTFQIVTVASTFIFGSRKSALAGAYALNISGSSMVTSYGASGNDSLGTASKNKVTIDKNKNSVYVNGVLKATQDEATFTTPGALEIFAAYNSGSEGQLPSSIKLYSFKMYDNDVLVRDFIPCYRIADNEIGLFDLVNETFYTNKGTGVFSKGADTTAIPTQDAPIPVESLGEYDQTTGKYKISIKSNDVVTNIYLDEPLRKVGDYADYIDFKNKKVVRNVGVHTFDGTETWVRHTTTSSGGYGVFRNEDLLTPLIGAPISATFMSHFSLTYLGSTSGFSKDLYRFAYSSGNAISSSRIYVSATQTTVEDFQEWLSTNKPSIYYPLATPTEETIELPHIPTKADTTILSMDAEIQPSYMEATYYGRIEYLSQEEDDILNYILSTNTQTEKDISDNEIIRILDEIIGG